MKKPELRIEFICKKCGNKQKPDDKQSNKNWEVFPTNKKCKCGGKFEIAVKEE